MADTALVVRLRPMIDEPNSTTYSDQALSDLIDQAEDNLDLAAAEVWQQKAGRFSSLVDTSESGSSRSNSQLSKNATSMASYYAKKVQDAKVTVEETRRPTRTRSIERR